LTTPQRSLRQLFGRPNKDPAPRVAASSVALAACADIANASKHFSLDGPSYSEGGHAEITSESMSSLNDLPEALRGLIDDVPRFGEHQWHWWITTNGEMHDAMMLAEKAMDDWTARLVSLGLVLFDPNGWIYRRYPSGWLYWSLMGERKYVDAGFRAVEG
jgi:hypothetical protein